MVRDAMLRIFGDLNMHRHEHLYSKVEGDLIQSGDLFQEGGIVKTEGIP